LVVGVKVTFKPAGVGVAEQLMHPVEAYHQPSQIEQIVDLKISDLPRQIRDIEIDNLLDL